MIKIVGRGFLEVICLHFLRVYKTTARAFFSAFLGVIVYSGRQFLQYLSTCWSGISQTPSNLTAASVHYLTILSVGMTLSLLVTSCNRLIQVYHCSCHQYLVLGSDTTILYHVITRYHNNVVCDIIINVGNLRQFSGEWKYREGH